MENTNLLLFEIKKGNVKAFEKFFHHYYPRLLAYATRFIADKSDASDLVQDSFIKFWEKRDEIYLESITSFLFILVRNNCLNYLKHRAVVEKYQSDYIKKQAGDERLYHADFLGNTDTKLLYDEFLEQIEQILEKLPKRCKQVFIMSRYEGLKNREIADKLQISLTAVEKHITRALADFTRHFKKNYPMEVAILFLFLLESGTTL